MKKRITRFLLVAGLTAGLIFAQAKPAKVIAIKGARIVPVVGDDIETGTIIIKDGEEIPTKDADFPRKEAKNENDETSAFRRAGALAGLRRIFGDRVGSNGRWIRHSDQERARL